MRWPLSLALALVAFAVCGPAYGASASPTTTVTIPTTVTVQTTTGSLQTTTAATQTVTTPTLQPTIVIKGNVGTSSWLDAVSRLLVALVWPAAITIGLWLLWKKRLGRVFMHSMLGRVEHLDAAGLLDVNFRDEDTHATKAALDYVFDEYRASAKEAYKVLAAGVLSTFEDFAKQLNDVMDVSEYQVTVYLRDLVFDEGLFQLYEYYDQSGKSTGGRAGRVYPFRYGAIGLAFRRGTFAVGDDVVLDVEELIKTWGWTRLEAERATIDAVAPPSKPAAEVDPISKLAKVEEGPHAISGNAQSHACVIVAGTLEEEIKTEGRNRLVAYRNPTAGIYIRADVAHAFKYRDEPEMFASKVREIAVRCGLQTRLETLGRKIDERRAELKFAPGQV